MEWDSGKLSGGENQWLERELYELRSRVGKSNWCPRLYNWAKRQLCNRMGDHVIMNVKVNSSGHEDDRRRHHH